MRGHHLRGEATTLQIARLLFASRRLAGHRDEHQLDELFQLGSGRHLDRNPLTRGFTDLRDERGVPHPDTRGAPWWPHQGCLQGREQNTADRPRRSLRLDHLLTHHEPAGQLHPHDELRAVGLVAVRDEEGQREKTGDPHRVLDASPSCAPTLCPGLHVLFVTGKANTGGMSEWQVSG